MPNISSQRQQIRRQIRKRRQQLTASERMQAEHNITAQALRLIEQRQAQHIALYLSFDSEISTRLLIERLWQQGKAVCLPVLHPFCDGHLLFLRYSPDTVMIKNRFAITEPLLDIRHIVPINELDIIFTPLVAFDKQGNRLGMGGGFYDRTLQNWQQQSFIPVGLAHRCQEVDELPVESWDIPLFAVLKG